MHIYIEWVHLFICFCLFFVSWGVFLKEKYEGMGVGRQDLEVGRGENVIKIYRLQLCSEQ